MHSNEQIVQMSHSVNLSQWKQFTFFQYIVEFISSSLSWALWLLVSRCLHFYSGSCGWIRRPERGLRFQWICCLWQTQQLERLTQVKPLTWTTVVVLLWRNSSKCVNKLFRGLLLLVLHPDWSVTMEYLSHLSGRWNVWQSNTISNVREMSFLWRLLWRKNEEKDMTNHTQISDIAEFAKCVWCAWLLSHSLLLHFSSLYLCVHLLQDLLYLPLWLQRGLSVYLPSSAAPAPLTVCLKQTSNQTEAFDRGSLHLVSPSSGSCSFHL